jgi:hypothetical protein
MPGAVSDPRLDDDAVLFVNLTGLTTATRGDYMGWNGRGAIPMTAGQAGYPYSGIGIMLDQNPVWVGPDQSASALGKARIATRGIFRVTGTGEVSAGQYAAPIDNGSGIVGQTGLTGKGALWSAITTVPTLASAVTARIFSASGNAVNVVTGTAAYERYTITPNSAVAQIVRVGATGSSGQWDIRLLDPRLGAVPQVNA